ncbi:M42 family metallopeptidase [Candidatus Halobonum tyrrellensis]|uniref:Cellulase n=1 Tax=Candidatus Halobonum tyrrellensis G22 TaxID=1324957 RepID=V4GP29_9EURY|nr:M42 family metallopeptidase [Candidatus Halobonum tyrrellensis]ESP87151.1 cellulase [Candidatus Halobonum tyrrellensis G22]
MDHTLDGSGLLRDLTEAHGPVGYEDAVRELAVAELDGSTDRVRTDAMGNVVGSIEGRSAPDFELLVAAHVDEVGFMISHVDDDGFLRLDALGGWNPEVLRAQRVRVHADGGADPVDGVLGAVPAHVRDDDEPLSVGELAVDVGLPAEAARDRVSVGDPVTLRAPTERLGRCIAGKALDDRAGVWTLLRAAERADPAVTVHFCATTQEEVGLRGARALGADLDPDLALAVDGTLERGVPGVDEADRVTELGAGVGVKRKDATVVPTPTVVEWLETLAADRDIPTQPEVASNIGTDTGALQTAAGATPVGALSVPVRYHHSPVETAHVRDLRATAELVTAGVDADPADLRGVVER